jgi:hypothetical protein
MRQGSAHLLGDRSDLRRDGPEIANVLVTRTERQIDALATLLLRHV